MIHQLVKGLIPPLLLTLIDRVLGRSISYSGDYKTWLEAESKSSGYDNSKILHRTLMSTRKVLDGEAAFERDGVTFPKLAYDWPLLTSLLWIATQEGKKAKCPRFWWLAGQYLFATPVNAGTRRPALEHHRTTTFCYCGHGNTYRFEASFFPFC